MSGVINDAKKKTQQMAQQVARQIAQEPLEILKDAGKQVLGTPEAAPQQPQKTSGQQPSEYPDMAGRAQKVKQQDTRLLGALEQEIMEIRMQKAKKQEQIKMAEQEQKQQQAQVGGEAPPAVTSKRSRRMGAQSQGQKATVERQQKHVESPVQSST